MEPLFGYVYHPKHQMPASFQTLIQNQQSLFSFPPGHEEGGDLPIVFCCTGNLENNFEAVQFATPK